jgi:type VI secretion system secreted protein VgrG
MRWRAEFDEDVAEGRLEVRRMIAREALSRPFEVEVEFLADDPDLDLAAVLGCERGVALLNEDASPEFALRRFHGMVAEADYLGEVDGRHRYRFVLRPRTHELELRRTSRVFRDMNAIEIVDAVLRSAGCSAAWETRARYATREQCVQYRERDQDFVSRLLEDEGVFYWYEHDVGAHTMRCGDDATSHVPIAGEAVLPFTTMLQADRESVSDLVVTSRVVASGHGVRDWNWRDPRAPVAGEAVGNGMEGLMTFEHPGSVGDADAARRRAALRLAQAVVRRREVRGRSNCMRLRAGAKFSVVDAVPASCDGELLLVEVEHRFEETPGNGPEGGLGRYEARFVGIPAVVEFRPTRTTPLPVLPARELARVVTHGDEVDVDESGRVAVQFHWGRGTGPTSGETGRLRVQQMNLGGSMMIPRGGWEVEVGFIDGDPDRVVVLQRMHRADAPPPEALPESGPRGVLGGRTVPGGAGINTVRFDDARDAMTLWIHAAREFEVTAGHDLEERVGANSEVHVDGSSHEDVGAREAVTVEGAQTHHTHGKLSARVGGARRVTVRVDDSRTVLGAATVTVSGDRRETVQGDREVFDERTTETVEKSFVRKVEGAVVQYSGEEFVEVVGGDRAEQTTDQRVEVVEALSREETGGNVKVETDRILEVVGGDLLQDIKGNLALQVAGKVDERVTGDVLIKGRSVAIEGATSVVLKVGGVSLTARDGAWTGRAPSIGVAGHATLEVKGPLEFTAPAGVSSSAPAQERPEGTTWTEVELVDPMGNPVPRKRYRLELADGSVREGVVNELGFAREDGIPDGATKITFPDLDKDAWRKVE